MAWLDDAMPAVHRRSRNKYRARRDRDADEFRESRAIRMQMRSPYLQFMQKGRVIKKLRHRGNVCAYRAYETRLQARGLIELSCGILSSYILTNKSPVFKTLLFSIIQIHGNLSRLKFFKESCKSRIPYLISFFFN